MGGCLGVMFLFPAIAVKWVWDEVRKAYVWGAASKLRK